MDWNKLLELGTVLLKAIFFKTDFVKCPYEHTLSIKHQEGDKILIICLYVDDLIYTGNDTAMST